jgi:hypothetical protein
MERPKACGEHPIRYTTPIIMALDIKVFLKYIPYSVYLIEAYTQSIADIGLLLQS